METEDDQDLPECADNDAAQGCADDGDVEQGLEHQGQHAADDAGHRSDDQVGQRGHDHQYAHRGNEVLDHVGQVLVEPLLQLGRKEAADHDGDYGGGVAGGGEDHGDAEEGGIEAHLKGSPGQHRPQGLAALEGHHGGVAQGNTKRHACVLAHLELLRSGVAQDDRQEVEEAVGHSIPDHVRAAGGVQQVEEGQQRQNALDDTGGAQQGDGRRHDAGDHVDEDGGNVLLAAGGTVILNGVAVLVYRAHALEVPDLQHRVVDLANRVADDHLVLAVGLDNLEYAVRLVEDIGVCLALVHEFKAQPGDAVGDAVDVLLAAHILDNNTGQPIILTCHGVPLLFNSFSPPPQPPAGRRGTALSETAPL